MFSVKKCKKNGPDEKAIKAVIRKKVYEPCNQVKVAIAKKDILKVSILDDKSRTQLKKILSSYPQGYTFEKNSIYYDITVKPENHLEAFFKLAELFEAAEAESFTCFPFRTTFIPCHMTLDTKIVTFHIFKSKKAPKVGSKFEIGVLLWT
jgi:hypothetical protein